MVDRVESFLERKYCNDKILRKSISTLYQSYASWGIKDRKFEQDFCDGRNDHFYPYLWEMLLARHLKNLGLHLSSKDEGPDFKIEHQGQTIWIEATCPTPKEMPKDAKPHLASALTGKKDKLTGRVLKGDVYKSGYLTKNIVAPNDPYVIAINACRLCNIEIHTNALRAATEAFQSLDYTGISALLATSQGIEAIHEKKLSMFLFHNPLAKNKLPFQILGVDEEYEIGGDRIS